MAFHTIVIEVSDADPGSPGAPAEWTEVELTDLLNGTHTIEGRSFNVEVVEYHHEKMTED